MHPILNPIYKHYGLFRLAKCIRLTVPSLLFLPLHLYAAEETAEDLTSIQGILDTLQRTLLDIWQNFLGHMPYLIAGVLVLIITALVANLFGRIGAKLGKRAKLRSSLQNLVQRLITIATWVLGLLLTAMLVFPGLTPTKALGGLGLASVAVGLAFKDIFENFFAGILLLWRFPFENGDFIECEGIMGRVENVSVRMTQIRLVSGELTVVPNSFLFKNPVYVLTDKEKRRQSIIVGIAYDETVDEAIPVIRSALEACETVDKNQPIEIFMKEFGASSVDIEVTWWTDPTPLGQRRSRNEVVASVKRALDDNGIEIPYPYRTLVFKNTLKTEGINLSSGQ